MNEMPKVNVFMRPSLDGPTQCISHSDHIAILKWIRDGIYDTEAHWRLLNKLTEAIGDE